MTIRSILELLAQADATIEDNTTQQISAADVRNLFKDFLDTMSPAYGAIQCTSVAETLGATPQLIAPFTSQAAVTAGYFTSNLTNGSVTRSSAVAGITDFIIASGSVAGGNNNNVVVEIFKGGVATGYKASVTCAGAGDAQAFNIAGITYTAAGTATYDIRATGPAGSYTFTDVSIIAQAQPVRSFV
jgi:hypothetical protein